MGTVKRYYGNIAFVLVAAVFQMNTIIWIAKNTLSVAITAIVIIFQPEIRKALENLGQKNFLTSFLRLIFQREKSQSLRIKRSMNW